ncbi:MAG TPA: DUF1934 domain-containing protein [Clostridiaceae bacterium]
MDKRAIISVSSNHGSEEDDIVEVVTAGEFFKKEDCYYAIYEETEISGMEGTTTTFKIYKDKFLLIREGTTSAVMNFEKDKEEISLYNTPYGSIEIKIDTIKLDIHVDDIGVDILIDYKMSLAGQKALSTFLKVNIKA